MKFWSLLRAAAAALFVALVIASCLDRPTSNAGVKGPREAPVFPTR
jgi:hypothetical protein